MRETKIYETIFPFQVLFCVFVAMVVDEMERTTDEGFSNAFVGFGDASAGHAGFFVAEVEG